MTENYLSQYYSKFAVKRISAVEVDKEKSNQQEFNANRALIEVFGREDLKDIKVRFLGFGENFNESFLLEDGIITWYDARKMNPTRTEYRLYYRRNAVMESINEGDLLIVAKRSGGEIDLILAEAHSTYDRQLSWLFGITEGTDSNDFHYQSIEGSNNTQINFVEGLILEELGIEVMESQSDFLDNELEQFLESGFPNTKVFSKFARDVADKKMELSEPDDLILHWMNYEEKLFRRLEKHIVEAELERHYKEPVDVDKFLQFSLSVQNRRKSRAGHALENHLNEIFSRNDLRYSKNKTTENKSKPDFLFPGISHYEDQTFDHHNLTMLGVKRSCKDRWRQVLAEASKIDEKHLFTLEPAISTFQTNEMKHKNLTLVLPEKLHETYNASQRSELLNLSQFIEIVKERQNKIYI